MLMRSSLNWGITKPDTTPAIVAAAVGGHGPQRSSGRPGASQRAMSPANGRTCIEGATRGDEMLGDGTSTASGGHGSGGGSARRQRTWADEKLATLSLDVEGGEGGEAHEEADAQRIAVRDGRGALRVRKQRVDEAGGSKN